MHGLQQGCTKAPTWFNLYACVEAESWMSRMHDIDGVGMYIIILNARLLTLQEVHYRNAREDVLYKCEFVALLTTTRTVAEAAISAYSSDARKFGLTVALPRQSGCGSWSAGRRVTALSINSCTID